MDAKMKDGGPAVHVLDQSGQGYGSRQRCCNHCGVMIWPGMGHVPPHVDSWDDWQKLSNRCSVSN